MSTRLRAGGEVARDWAHAIGLTQRLATRADPSLAALVEEMAAERGSQPALIGSDTVLSYAELAGRANQVARWALAQGLQAGEVVALLAPNSPDYVATWLGLSQVGCTVALLNTNLKPEGLAHCIRSAGARHVIASPTLRGPHEGDAQWWVQGEAFGLAGLSGAPLTAAERRPPQPGDPALLIYSSGTTGLPKAAFITHARVLEWSGWFAGLMNAQPADRLYDCLPLYHSTGGVVAVGAMLVSGGSVVIRERFSASRFWADVADTGCTIFQYIGELCRYLLNATPPGHIPPHALRLCCGNGLGEAVWDAFQSRFAIPQVLEFYAATEGLLSLYNCEGKPGAIGRGPPFLAHRVPGALSACDPETGEPVRDAEGRCQACAPGEPGEAIAQLRREPRIYTDAAASARKLLHSVFAEGDCWFRSGDLMRRDGAGFYGFVDRLGDTFRWKGENVSTAEVDAAVFGVAIPGAEGKAGMAAVVLDSEAVLPALRAHLHERLPPYARPLFVRRCDQLDTTATFKLSKVTLARQGYGPEADPVWFNDPASGAFIRLDARLRSRLAAGTLAL